MLTRKRLSATQCLSHPWLRRKPPVAIQPPKAPTIVKVEKTPPSELDLAKDNLKFFVERWNEHPNSPYIFDTSCQTISPCVSFNNIPDHRSRTPSLSGYSPSPCDSISLADVDITSESPPMSPKRPSFPGISVSHLKNMEDSPSSSPVTHYLDRLQMFDRRASDSSCLVRHTNDVASRINLAEEIKKLSDKLLKINNQLNNNNNEEFAFTYETENDNNNLIVKTTSQVVKKYSDSGKHGSSGFAVGKSSTLFYTATSTTRSTSFGIEDKVSVQDSSLPRRKFKFLNRDVAFNSSPSTPDCEAFSDTSSTLSSAGHSNPSTPDLFPDTPDQAKNLLHLLAKYEDFAPKTEKRRTSLSITWSEVESLGQRTMKSLSNFMQASRNTENKQKTTAP
ncbi:hypothetical protein RUM43_006409 [Polyplax serrata]|uniref:Uncharacterized protein n=1 Tax=Polyplax serrata TaxID=468196 RepID=A0AAN8NY64_POLSC